MSSFLAKGRFALGMIIGSLGTVLLLVFLIGPDYCPKSPCGIQPLYQHLLGWHATLSTSEKIGILELVLLSGVLFAGVGAFKAATRTNDLRESLDRPFLAALPPKGDFRPQLIENVDGQILFSIKNVGGTPAEVISVARKWHVGEKGEPYREYEKLEPLCPSERQSGEKDFPIVIGGNQDSPLIVALRPDYLSRPLERRDFVLFFHGFVRYKDAVGKRRVHGFLFFVDVSKDGPLKFSVGWPYKDIDKFHYQIDDPLQTP